MWDRVVVLWDRHFKTQIVIEASDLSPSKENTLVSIAGNFWNGRWIVRSARPAGKMPPQDFFPSLVQVTLNSAFHKSNAGRILNTDQVMNFLAKAETNQGLTQLSRNQITAFKKTAHSCGWRKRPDVMDFGLPPVRQEVPPKANPFVADPHLFM